MSVESLKDQLKSLEARYRDIESDMQTADNQSPYKARLMDIRIKMNDVRSKLNAASGEKKPDAKPPAVRQMAPSQRKKLDAALKGIDDRFGRKSA